MYSNLLLIPVLLETMNFETVQPFLNLGAVGILTLYLVRNQTKQNNYFVESMDKIIQSIDKFANNIGKTLLDRDQTILVIKSLLFEHIDEKVNYALEILRHNDIHNRVEQIEKNLRIKYAEITQRITRKLSMFNTPAGDCGRLLTEFLDFSTFMEEVYVVFFSDSDIDTKALDLRSLMKGYCTAFLEKVNKEINKNNI